MANHAYYEMKVVGDPINVKEFIDIMVQKEFDLTPNGRPHFFRIFDASLIDKSEVKNGFAHLHGYCAWSVTSCMTDHSAYTYYRQNKKDDQDKNEVKLPNASHLEEVTQNLNLKVEIYAEEPGVGFEEHLIFDNGDCIRNEEVDMYEYSTNDFDNVDDFNIEYNLHISKDEFKNNDYIKHGGFNIWEYTI